MSQLQRARSPAARDARRTAILAAARRLLAHQRYEAVTMAAVARAARLAKGTVFLYFPTRETLFLHLLEELSDEWLGAVHEAVAQESGSWTSSRLAGLIADTLAARSLLARLLPLGDSVLVPGVEPARAADFRHRLLRRRFATGALIEQKLGLARRGDGVRLLQLAHALIAGLGGPSDPPPARGPGSSGGTPPDTDAGADVRAALTVLFNGFHRRAV